MSTFGNTVSGTQPSWQSTLGSFLGQKTPNATPSPAPNGGMTPVPTGGGYTQPTTQPAQVPAQSANTSGMKPYTGTGSYQTINGQNYSVPTPTQSTGTVAGANTGSNTGIGSMYGTAQQGLTNYGTGSGNQNVNTAIGTSQGVANNQGTYAPQIGTAIGTLGNISQNQTPAVTQAEKQYTDFASQSPWQVAGMQNNPNMLANIATGNAANMSAAAAQEQSALGQNVANQLTGQGQQIGAAQDVSQQGQSAQGQMLSATGQAGRLAQGQQNQQNTALSGVAGPISGPGGYLYSPQNNVGTPSSQATNVGTAGTVGAIAANNPAYSAAYTALNGADGQSGINQQMQSTLSTNPQLNSMPWSIVNGALNLSQQYLQGNPSAVSFLSQANQAIQGYTTILGSGPVQGALQNIQSQGISQVLQTLNGLAQAKIMGQNAGMNGTSPSSAVAGATPLQSNNYTVGQTFANGSIKWDGSKFVAN